NTRTAKPTKLRTSITPGTVLILLAGRFRGKRVVFLKQLEGGLLLVTGPFRVNGVPLKRVAQSYVLATSTKIDISGAQLPEELSDDLFKGPRKTIKQLSEQKFFGDKVEKAPLPESFIALQKQVDQAIIAEVSKTPLMTNYLKNTFTLKKGQAPHLMKF
ncbi:ribosomal protein L6e-domain-containing protein, partial [Dimargaris cristalligena]